MNHTEFVDLHAASEKLMRSYFVEVEKSSTMIADCTEKPPSLQNRLKLMSQGVIEHEAHVTYMDTKSLLLDAVRVGCPE
jgi:hypothetical protein